MNKLILISSAIIMSFLVKKMYYYNNDNYTINYKYIMNCMRSE